jgi:hypothetical protein
MFEIAKGQADETNYLWHPCTVKAYEGMGSTFQLEKYFFKDDLIP